MENPEPYIEKTARAFNIDPATLEPLTDGNTEADVLKGESPSGLKVLKIYPADMVEGVGGTEAVREGLLYQEGLAERLTGDVAFAGPLRSESGKLGEVIETNEGPRVAMVFELAPGKEVYRRGVGYQVPITDSEVGKPLFERVGSALGIMHKYASQYPVWWPAAAADHPDTPFSGRKDSSGATPAPAPVNVGDNFIIAAVADEPELSNHWESIQANRRTWIPERNEFGYLHFDFGLANMLYTTTRLTIIDHMALFGWFFDDITSPFLDLRNEGIPNQLIRTYWLSFVTGYNKEFTVKKEWIPRLRTTLDSRRFMFYGINMYYKKKGVESADFPMLEKWREDMIAERPFVDLDFSLP